MGKGVPLSGIYDPRAPALRRGQGVPRRSSPPRPHLQEVVETAKGLEGLKRQWGVHAAGVIMSSEPLIDVIPIMRRLQDGQVITQFDYPSCEALGLVKMDFLGLRNLTILDDAIANVKANRGEDIDLDELSRTLDDKPTYDLLARGDTLGVFQLDGGGMRTLLKLMQPDSFEDISAALALYRPGPMGVNAHTNFALRKNGKQEVVPLDPQLKGKLQPEMVEALDPILGTTHGLVIYQEQVMEIAQKLAGYTLGNADLLRRAMGKKKKSVLDAEYVPFSEGMKAKGFTEASIAALWGVLVPFSDYAFNKAHTAAYGLVSYWTAYLKANYPAEYMAALLTSVGDDKDKSALYLGECRRMGIKVLPPDVNDSIGQFAAVGTDIRFGLQAIRNVGHHVVEDDRAGPGGERPLHLLPRLHVQGAGGGLQQADHRVAHQGRGVRRPGRDPDGPAPRPRGVRRRVRRRQAAGGDRPGQPVRRVRRRRRCCAAGGDLMGLRAGAGGRVGQVDPAHLRARDARALRLGPPAVRHGARAHGTRRHPHRGPHERRRRQAGGLHGDRRRAHHRAPGQAHQEGRPLGDRDGRGPRRRDRVPLLPHRVPDRGAAAPAGHRRGGAGQGQPARRHRVDLRPGAHPARRQRRSTRSGGRDDGDRPSHGPAGRGAEGRC